MMLFGRKKPSGMDQQAEAEGSYVELPRVPAFPLASEGGEAPPAQTAAPYLEVRIGFLAGEFPLRADVVRIGRADAEQNYRPDIDLGSDDAVSRRHAEIRRRGSQFFLVDLGSTNGTQLNGEPIAPHVEVPLSNGSEIRLGAMTLLKVHL
ncbi:MAG: FHA domain-containing protein [Abditibacteriales bacterium]|nr:FHA domain-containing protein [Abditibacteriales bacterium]MDW8364762.1 FHA domain-containing protein [Abditibacteriales bacterium]